MMLWMRCCLILALSLVLKVELAAQWTFEAGPARLAVPLPGSSRRPGKLGKGTRLQLPARVPIYQGSRLVGQGELLPWLPKAGMAELRALLPKGRFHLGRPQSEARTHGPVVPASKLAAGIQAAGLEMELEAQEGGLYPRFRARGSGPALDIRADLYRYPGHGCELRLYVLAGQEHEQEARLQIQGEIPADWLQGRDLRLAGLAADQPAGPDLVQRWISGRDAAHPRHKSWKLALPSGYLRPGDGVEILLLALEGGDPEEKAIGAVALRKGLGQGPARPPRRPSRGLRRRMDADLDRVLTRTRKQAPTDRGDHLRRPAGKGRPALWSHLEFDLPLGLHLLGCERKDRDLVSSAWIGLQHLMGRDRSRPWRNETLGYRLPVRHGARHGIGKVALGHVFLESALLVSALRCNRVGFEDAREALDALSDLVPRSLRQVRQLRDFAWPLADLEMGLRLLDRPPWTRSADLLIASLASLFREGAFDLRESHLPDGGRSLDLWLVAGLLLPALDSGVLRGSKTARRLRTRLLQHLSHLPGSRGGYATRYAVAAKGPWYASGAKVDPCFQAWLIEGLLGRKGMPASLRSRHRRVLGQLPGQVWDPATRLAFLLRWPRIRAELR